MRDWWKSRGKEKVKKRKPFDSGAVILDGPSTTESAAGVSSPRRKALTPDDAAPRQRKKLEGQCVICFEEKPK